MRAFACLLLFGLVSSTALANHEAGSGSRSLGGATLPQDAPVLVHVEAEDFARKAVGALVGEPNATSGSAWRLPTYGQVTLVLDVPTDGVVWLKIRARGEHPEGTLTTHMHAMLDGVQRGEWNAGPEFTTFRQSLPITKGPHSLALDNFNNYRADAPDRVLIIDWLELTEPFLDGVPHASANASLLVDGPAVHQAATGVARLDDADARGKTSWFMWGQGCFVEDVVVDDAARYHYAARIKGNAPGLVGSHTLLRANGKTINESFVGDFYETREADVPLPRGVSILEICYDNDEGAAGKRNLWLDEFSLSLVEKDPEAPTPLPSVPPSPSTLPSTPPSTSPSSLPAPSPSPSPSPSPPSTPAPPSESRAVPLPAFATLLAFALAAGARRR